jgi:hypothetical protein
MVSSACSASSVESGVGVGVCVEVAVGGTVVEEGRGVAVRVGISVGLGVTVRVAGSGVLETVSGMTPVDTHPDNTMTIGSRRDAMCLGLISASFFVKR